MNTRGLGCGKEVIAVGQDGSIRDLNTKLSVCAECSEFVECLHYIHHAKRLVASLENLAYMAEQIRKEKPFTPAQIERANGNNWNK